MPFRKVLMREIKGTPVASLTLRGDPPLLTLPAGTIALLLAIGEEILPASGDVITLRAGTRDFSLLAKRGDALLYASTLSERESAFAKWRLLSSLDKGERREESDRSDPPPESEGISEPQSIESTPPAEEIGEIERAEALLARGTPFPLFEGMMPGSRWALIHEDQAEYLVGIREEEDGAHILFGVPGSRAFPPDEETLWSFFPTEDTGEIGYFLTDAISI